ncbi:hypothetical protein QOZ80_6AG0505950 [Eleusine coracana subsp. coracana]|nr:hypothetical protein QOZ80_6AG0505950 [Eleusine coracana subsp. coracana]
MSVHHQPHHLLDFSAPPPGFDNDGLLALHHVDNMPAAAGGGGVLAGDTAPPPWPQAAVSLSLFNYNTAAGASSSSLVGHHHHQPFTAAQIQQLEVPATASLLQPFRQLRSSKYLGPVMELLSEFCSVEGDLQAMIDKRAPSSNKVAGNKWDDAAEALSSGLWGSPSLGSMDLMELERRKVRLLSMVEEVDKRYRRYREQIRSVEVLFDAVAGAGASQVYTRLARRAMSRHFRCLRDALVAQLRAVKNKAMMGSSDYSQREGSMMAAGATKGETPRLRVLDQCLRQQRALQQPAALDNYPWRPQRGLPEQAVTVLRAWLFEHFLHPYPNDVDKHILARQTGLSRSQVSNWFINARVRLWKPMIEEMYKEEVDQQQSEANQQNPSDTIVKAERTTTNFGEESYQQQQQYLSKHGAWK